METHIVTATSNRPVTEHQLCCWLGGANPGDILQYYRGFLAFDVSPSVRRLNEHQRKELLRVAQRARWASENGLVHLTQRRYGVDDYAYFVEAKVRPKLGRKSMLAVLGGDPDGRADGRRSDAMKVEWSAS
jgi:hypothetical protein